MVLGGGGARGAGGGWGEWMVLGRGEDGFAGDGLGEEVVVVGVYIYTFTTVTTKNVGSLIHSPVINTIGQFMCLELQFIEG